MRKNKPQTSSEGRSSSGARGHRRQTHGAITRCPYQAGTKWKSVLTPLRGEARDRVEPGPAPPRTVHCCGVSTDPHSHGPTPRSLHHLHSQQKHPNCFHWGAHPQAVVMGARGREAETPGRGRAKAMGRTLGRGWEAGFLMQLSAKSDF